MRKTIPFVIISIIIILIVFLILASRVTFKENAKVEIHSISNASSLIENEGLLNSIYYGILLDTGTLGEHYAEVYIKTLFITRSKTVKYEVVDTIAPEMDEVYSFHIKKHEDVSDILTALNIYDNSECDVKLEIDGYYSFDMPGSYDVIVTATDESGNSISKAIK